jgi:hypothetical protein
VDPQPNDLPPTPYVAPALVRLGTLAELTQGGWAGIPDGIGGAPGEGSFEF